MAARPDGGHTGVENGLTVARAARNGDLVVSDAHGRIRAEAHSADAPFVSIVTTLPAHSATTAYTRFGDWFAWTCVLLLLAGLTVLTRTRRRTAELHAEPRVAPNDSSAVLAGGRYQSQSLPWTATDLA